MFLWSGHVFLANCVLDVPAKIDHAAAKRGRKNSYCIGKVTMAHEPPRSWISISDDGNTTGRGNHNLFGE